jgi:hypothetical protein
VPPQAAHSWGEFCSSAEQTQCGGNELIRNQKSTEGGRTHGGEGEEVWASGLSAGIFASQGKPAGALLHERRDKQVEVFTEEALDRWGQCDMRYVELQRLIGPVRRRGRGNGAAIG